jgi:adenylate kinase
LAQRDDDREETVRERLKLYHSTTAPIIHFYTSSGVVIKVDGAGSIDMVSREIKVLLRGSGKQ